LAAARRAVMLEPDNWRHHLRLSYSSWGEERLRQARRTLALLPDFPIAHWLAATVQVARGALEEAERELEAAVALMDARAGGSPRFTAVALHWLLGLTYLARGETARALTEFEVELAEDRRHLYARECCANACYAIGALHLHEGRLPEARVGFARALEQVARHPMARVAIASLENRGQSAVESPDPVSFEAAMCRAALLVADGRDAEGADLLAEALAQTPEGDSGWLLPVEPLLRVYRNPSAWATALARLRARAV
jgi:tetratricopeptide (TPR) repeat protein